MGTRETLEQTAAELQGQRSTGKDRRRVPRFPFVAEAEIREKSSGASQLARVSELSLYGCHIEMEKPLAEGTELFVKIFTGTDYFEAPAKVVFSQAEWGMGLAFHDVGLHYLPVLKKWLHAAMQQMTTMQQQS